MVSGMQQDPAKDRIGEVMVAVQMPLENVEYAVAQYLLSNAHWLDPETRKLLAGVRDCIGRVAVSTRRLTRDETAGEPTPPSLFEQAVA